MAAAAPAVKTEPIAEIDIKEEPLDGTQQELAAQSPSVAAAQKLLQHQLSGIKNTLKASSKRVESIDSKASIIKDVNQNSSSKDPAGSSQQSKDDGEEGELSDDDHPTPSKTAATPSKTSETPSKTAPIKFEVKKPIIKKLSAAEEARAAKEDEAAVKAGKAARMPVWVSLGDEEEFPLPHWIGVSGTSSDNLNLSTKVVLNTRVQEIDNQTQKQWDKEIKETEVRIDAEGVRRISSRMAAREVKRGGGGRGQLGRGFGQDCSRRAVSPVRNRGRSRSPVAQARRRSRTPPRRSPVRRQRSRSRTPDKKSSKKSKRGRSSSRSVSPRRRARSRSSSVQSVRSSRRKSRSPARRSRSSSADSSRSPSIITRRTIKREKMSRSRSRSPVKSRRDRRDRSRSSSPKSSKSSKKSKKSSRRTPSLSPSPEKRRIKTEPGTPASYKIPKIKREPRSPSYDRY